MKIRCFKCEGKGKVRDKIDWFLGVMSLGMTALMDLGDWYTCSGCKGKGYLEDIKN